eukprot:454029-Amphidinium_carterae.1
MVLLPSAWTTATCLTVRRRSVACHFGVLKIQDDGSTERSYQQRGQNIPTMSRRSNDRSWRVALLRSSYAATVSILFWR